MDNLPKGKANEIDGDGRKTNPTGLYFHEGSKGWMDCRSTPQADAAVRVGFVLANAEQKKFVESERARLLNKKEETTKKG